MKKRGDWVVFFGGEPLLAPQIIDNFIKKFQNTKIRFAMYTNGLLLDKIPKAILKKIAVIFVSADGDKKTQEKHRGVGSHHRVIENIDLTRKKTDAQFIGRMTIDEETNLYESTINLLKHTDLVHWQIANKPIFRNPNKFVKSYKTDLEKLFDFWMDNFKKGTNINIIPFQAIVSSLIFNYPKNKSSFRCGVGRSVQVIDADGKIYWCDELVGNKKAFIGSIANKRVKNNYKAHFKLFDDCKNCNISKICRGRCRKCLEVYIPKHNRMYCELTKFLINIIEKRLDEIKKTIKKQNLTLNNFYKMRYLTEEIP